MGINIRPCDSKVKVWEYANFSSNWFTEEAKDDSDAARSRLVFVLSYLGCPVM